MTRPLSATSNWPAVWRRFRPEAEAVVDVGTDQRWTWTELHRQSLAWAARLQREGVGSGDRVALLALNRAETFALLFAVAELGAVLFPLNWRLSPEELRWQLEHSRSRLLLVDEAHWALELGLPRLLLEEGPGTVDPDGWAGGAGCRLEDPWMLMYTSGSTGKPKGAMLSHGQVHWNALNTILACDLDAGCSTLTFAPLFHTGGMNSLSTPLLHRGGKVVLVPRLEPAEALALIEGERITHLMGVPTIYQMLADHPDFATRDLSSLRDALCGGAPLALPLFLRYRSRNIPLRQGFGLTEVGPNCFSMPIGQAEDKMRGDPSDPTLGPPGSCVGMPIHHIDARLLRPDGSECAVGEPGELVLGGPAVFAGYLDDPGATERSIQGGFFYTGDQLSRDRDGFFYVRGRLKEMYKSGGENVYPAEVEAALQQCPGVAQVAVVGVPDARWGEVGRAFVEADPGVTLVEAELRAFLDGKLARFKLPKLYTFEALPRTGSGKIDKVALRARPLPGPALP